MPYILTFIKLNLFTKKSIRRFQILKKFKKIIYIILIIVIAVLSFVIYLNASKGKENNQNEKVFSEIKYIESKLVDIFNEMNKIESRNYSISVGEVSKETTEKSSGESSSSSGSGGGSGGTSSGGQASNQEGSTSNDKQDNKKFDLKISGVLTNDGDINWNLVKSEIENLYTSIATVTIDLYSLETNKNDILEFNQQLDNTTKIVKNENKQEALLEMAKLYGALSKITQGLQGEETYKILIETKSNIFNAYSKLDTKNWNEISKDINSAISVYSKLLSNVNLEPENQYSINKGYILLNEMQNAVNSQDISLFLIKYKNLLEEINSI